MVRDGCEGWWGGGILLCKRFKRNSYFFPIFSGKFLFFSYFLGAWIPIFLFFWPFLLLDALMLQKCHCNKTQKRFYSDRDQITEKDQFTEISTEYFVKQMNDKCRVSSQNDWQMITKHLSKKIWVSLNCLVFTLRQCPHNALLLKRICTLCEKRMW